MSNIFEAVNKGKGELADFMLPMVGVQNESSAPCQQGTSESEPAQPVRIANPAPAAPVPDAFFPRQIRTLRLRIAAPSPLLPFEDNRSHASEQYRMLRTKISQHPKQPRLIVVSSAASRDGKTTTAVNMAGALALKNEAKVVLLDADLRKSTIHLQLGLPERPGASRRAHRRLLDRASSGSGAGISESVCTFRRHSCKQPSGIVG